LNFLFFAAEGSGQVGIVSTKIFGNFQGPVVSLAKVFNQT
jgi:hypothetical protein